MIDRKKYKNFALMQLKDRWTVPVLITLVILLIENLFSIPDRINTMNSLSIEDIHNISKYSFAEFMRLFAGKPKNQLLTFILQIILMMVQGVLTLASINVYLKMSRSPDPVSFSDFIEGFNDWGRGILGVLWMFLWLIIWGLIMIPVSILGSFFVMLFMDTLPMAVNSAFIITLSLLALIPMFIRSIAYSQFYYILSECPDISIPKALKLSIKITKGYKWEIFKTILSFLGWFVLAGLTFGIANLAVQPYYRMTMTNVYHGLMKTAIENHTVQPKELTANEQEI